MRYKFLLMSIIVFSTFSIASEKPHSPTLTKNNLNKISILCIGEQSVGFEWQQKKWVSTTYSPSKYLIQRIGMSEGQHGTCELEYMQNPPTKHGVSKGFLKGCYNLRYFGSELLEFKWMLCNEMWDKIDGRRQLSFITCSQNFSSPAIKFQPNGNFTASYIDSSLSSNHEKKLPTYVSVGSCSVIEGSLISEAP